MPEAFTTKHEVGIDDIHFTTVVEWYAQRTDQRYGRYVQIPGIDICGKTGTVQNPHGENHSIFIAFAPKDNPKLPLRRLLKMLDTDRHGQHRFVR